MEMVRIHVWGKHIRLQSAPNTRGQRALMQQLEAAFASYEPYGGGLILKGRAGSAELATPSQDVMCILSRIPPKQDDFCS